MSYFLSEDAAVAHIDMAHRLKPSSIVSSVSCVADCLGNHCRFSTDLFPPLPLPAIDQAPLVPVVIEAMETHEQVETLAWKAHDLARYLRSNIDMNYAYLLDERCEASARLVETIKQALNAARALDKECRAARKARETRLAKLAR